MPSFTSNIHIKKKRYRIIYRNRQLFFNMTVNSIVLIARNQTKQRLDEKKQLNYFDMTLVNSSQIPKSRNGEMAIDLSAIIMQKYTTYTMTPLQLCAYQVSGKEPKFLTDDHLKILKIYNAEQERFFLLMKTLHLSDPKAFILKYIPAHYGSMTLQRDISMYYQDSNQSEGTILWLSHLASRYKQRVLTNKFLVLQNLTHGYQAPCVFDIKIGRRNDIKKGSTISQSVINYCFKLNGCRMSYPEEERETFLSKYHLQSKTDFDSILLFVALFFFDGERLSKEAIINIRQKLSDFILGFRSTMGYLFVSSSIFLLYDAKDPTKADLKFIDFSRFRETPQDSFDQRSCKGLENIHMILGRILQSRDSFLPKLTQLKKYYQINDIDLIPDKKKSKNQENCLTPSPRKKQQTQVS